MLTYSFLPKKDNDNGAMIAIYDSSKTSTDWFVILLKWYDEPAYTLEEIRSQILKVNKCNDTKLTQERVEIWTPCIQQALKELTQRNDDSSDPGHVTITSEWLRNTTFYTRDYSALKGYVTKVKDKAS